MDTQISNIPVLEKNKVQENKTIEKSSCCAPVSTGSSCCTPSKTKEENNGACCAQPEDGSACCVK
jgi:hypothetical protein